MITALEVYRSLPRYLAGRLVAGPLPGLFAGPLTPLRMVNRSEPEVHQEGWARVRPRLAGICGSDLATLTGNASLYLSALVSLPFVPGHEVVGTVLDDCMDLPAGTRVVLDPQLGCAARGLEPCLACRGGAANRCDHVTGGHLSPGLQTGYCAATGGGWSELFTAHRSQLHPVPDELADETAVLVEPIACGTHAAARAEVPDGGSVLVLGAGPIGLFTLLGLRAYSSAGPVIVVAKHPRQAELARRFGATDVLAPADALSGVRRSTRALRLRPERGPDFLLGGVDVTVEAVGTRSSLNMALRATRAGGRVVLAGMPPSGVDLTPAWYRELAVVGAYGNGSQHGRASFDLAIELAQRNPFDVREVARYPLSCWREALDHSLSAGRLGTVKVAFDLRGDR